MESPELDAGQKEALIGIDEPKILYVLLGLSAIFFLTVLGAVYACLIIEVSVHLDECASSSIFPQASCTQSKRHSYREARPQMGVDSLLAQRHRMRHLP